MKNQDLLLMLGLVGLFLYSSRTNRTPEENRVFFRPVFEKASQEYAVPLQLLIETAQKESSFINKYIYGPDFNPSGAKGMMQIIPRWHPDLKNPFDPYEAIPYAASYLRELYNRFGSWSLALAAYNWGPTALAKHLAGDEQYASLPVETQNYVDVITAKSGV